VKRTVLTSIIALAVGCGCSGGGTFKPQYGSSDEMVSKVTGAGIGCTNGADQPAEAATFTFSGANARTCFTDSTGNEQFTLETYATRPIEDRSKQEESGTAFGFTYYSPNGWGVLAQTQSTLDVVKSALAS
jgi:hypothetical protein